ncbi:unnamed protein product [Rotaria sp. Silwood1]|nr:unnamed protein product [Rotaria sp. Silwood1]CAF1404139.1 unnamed protein product [Rotaria sp. Silwood1]CAF3512804.1 unnamed protein product [Rotaria sp. Silwood1]CAF3618959.1 unnamed protein product [Rotaria sp. Silwood1]
MNNVSNLTSSPSTIKPTPYRVQNYLVIWVDGNIDQASQDCQNTMAELRSIVKEVNVCTTSAQCIEILDDLDDEKAFVISSGALGQRLVPDIHRMPQLDTIYIFCSNKAWHEQWAKQWPKIQGIFTSITPICDSLKLINCEKNTFTFMDYYLSKLPGVGRFTGPRHFQILKNYAPSLTLFGAAALIYCLYITDWKVTNTRIPIYGRKFDEMKRVAMIDKHGQKAVDEGTASDD